MWLFTILGFGPTGWGGLLLTAMVMTLLVTVTSLVIGAVLGAFFASLKLSRGISARIVGDAYTTLFRGVPELLIIYVIYFGGTSAVTALGHLFGADGSLSLPSFAAGAIAVGVIPGAYQTEVFRGAYLAISRGEIEAAQSIGMPTTVRFYRIVVPQVLRFALPGLGNVFQLSLKDSALISVTGLAELMRASQVGAGSTHQYFLFYVTGGCLYLVLTSLSDQLFETAERRVRRTFRQASGRS